MRKSSTSLLAGLFAGAACVSASAQPAMSPSSASKTPASSGLLNDYLREQYPALTPLDIGGQFRGRFEAKSGVAVPGVAGAVDFSQATPDNNYWLLREKLHVGWKPASWISLFAEGRDSSSWNDKRKPEPEEDSLDLHQAYVALGNAKEFPLMVKVGRQELIYGDERLIGASDWNNLGRVFEAAKLRFENESIWVDAFTSRVVLANDGEFNVSNDYDWFSGVYASTKTLIPKQETQLYFLSRNTGSQSPTATDGRPQAGGPGARDIYTVGLRFKSLPDQFGGWDYEAEFAGQFGRFVAGGVSLDQEAFAGHVAGGYSWKHAFATPRLGLEYNFASGDSDPTDGKHGTFENLFPTNHKFYGFMDFVSWQNIHDVRLATSAKPIKGLSLTADYHLFWLADTADAFYNVSGAARATGGYGLKPANDSFLGSEIDIVATYAIKPFATAQLGYGHFFVGDYVEQSLAVAGSKDANWFYAQLNFNF